ncbi:MipA/OmpV family protein [Rheinheimera sp. MMS21-TC3]|uniref:MipA/OmpV family protein n=1 Tax=Rheinheimera sp. MMS21-TC3 TaxID=3072790 RepID=UPI0028C3CA3A|nr:MipA/OmpV family protein [Rheinheimera sp. MMS21-TC3]WNO59546.1 MipA/OmpV family protein [Rheinheimera sp. MMS21-TC3]
MIMRWHGLFALPIIFLCAVNQSQAYASTEPKAAFAFGVGATYSQLPDYLGSTVNQHYLLPFPYIVYQSDKIKVNQTEALGQLFQSGNWSLNLSLGGALPVNSENNPYRKDMPDLHWIAEAGPTLDYNIHHLANNELTLRLALRKAVATNLQHWQSVGWRFEPHLRWRKSLSNKVQFSSQLAAIWSTAQFHQYLYGVEQQYVNLQRTQYQADGGFSGWRLSSGLSWRYQQWWLGGFVRYDNLQQASYRDSPLVQRQHNVSFGIAFAWIFNQQGVIYEN